MPDSALLPGRGSGLSRLRTGLETSNPYVGFSKDRRQIASLWERFNCGLISPDDVEDGYQHMLLSEWQHCMQLGVDVAMHVGRRLSEDEYLARRAASRLLLEKSRPVIDSVSPYLEDVPGIFLLTECTGAILHVAGRPEVRRLACDRSNIAEGTLWDERVAGSNGIGSAIRRRQPVHVYSSEHFCEGWHTWSCAAAPIFEPDGETLIGIIDFTTIERDYRDQSLGLVVSLANSIQSQIAAHRQIERARLVAVLGGYRKRYPGDDILVFDRAGKSINLDPLERSDIDTSQHPALNDADKIDILDPDTEDRIGTIAIQRTRLALRSRLAPPDAPVTTAGDSEVEHFGAFQTRDETTRKMLRQLERVAAADVNIMISGETGTGKELLAQHIHASSQRQAHPYLAVNCAAISSELLESTFFGYVRGAFSGADPKGRAGYFESAGSGTLFLDEIGELPLAMQAALLRVLEDGSFQRVGSAETRRAGCRIIAATNRNLEDEIAAGRFRSDLYYRLKVMNFHIPPLRSRQCDILPLSRHFLQLLTAKHARPEVSLCADAAAHLQAYTWPGNVRELRNTIEAAVLCAEDQLTADNLPREITAAAQTASAAAAESFPDPEPVQSLLEHERQVIIRTLEKFRKVNRVARELGIARSTLYKKLATLGIDQSKYL